MRIGLTRIESPLGPMLLATVDGALVAAEFTGERDPRKWDFARAWPEAEFSWDRDGDAAQRLARYFDGDLGALDGVRVASRGSAFQQRVWAALRAIPCGVTRSYGEVAAAIGEPGAARAVGRANATNPVAIFVPCHRVIGANGALTGYAAGLDRKTWLLRHERALLTASRR